MRSYQVIYVDYAAGPPYVPLLLVLHAVIHYPHEFEVRLRVLGLRARYGVENAHLHLMNVAGVLRLLLGVIGDPISVQQAWRGEELGGVEPTREDGAVRLMLEPQVCRAPIDGHQDRASLPLWGFLSRGKCRTFN